MMALPYIIDSLTFGFAIWHCQFLLPCGDCIWPWVELWKDRKVFENEVRAKMFIFFHFVTRGVPRKMWVDDVGCDNL